jgi:hypothetical protein
MTDQEVDELAAILVLEHGKAARDVAEERKSLHESGPTASGYGRVLPRRWRARFR